MPIGVTRHLTVRGSMACRRMMALTRLRLAGSDVPMMERRAESER